MFSLVAMAMLEAEQPRGISGRTETELKKEREKWSSGAYLIALSMRLSELWRSEKWGRFKKKESQKWNMLHTFKLYFSWIQSHELITHTQESPALWL